MSDRITETIAEAVEGHLGCGEWCDIDGMSVTGRDEWLHSADAVVAALKAARIALIELPEEVVDEDGYSTWPVEQHWGGGNPDRPGAVSIRRTDGRITANSVGIPCDQPSDARNFAAALLAAAEKADTHA